MTLQELIVVVGADVGGFVDGMDSAISKANATESTLTSVGAALPAALVQPLAAVAEAMEQVGASSETLEGRVQKLIDSGSTLAEALATITAADAGLAGAMDKAGQSTQQLGAAVDRTFPGVNSLEDAFASLMNEVGEKGRLDALNVALREFADTAGKTLPPVVKTVQDGTTAIFSWADALKVLGISFSAVAIKDFVVDTLEAYAAIEKASVAITALSGDAQQANAAIAGLAKLAVADALSFPSLLTAEQRMLAFGFAAQSIPGALRSIADASAATGRSFDAVANSFERIVETGMVQSRTLVQLGINLKDLATAMGVTEGEAKKAFAALDQNERITVLDSALLKFKGDAELVAQTLSGQWTSMGTEFTLTMQKMGEALAPFAQATISAVRSLVIPALNEAIGKFKELSDAIVGAAQIIDTLGAPIASAANNILGLDKTLSDLIGGPLGKLLTLPVEAPTVAWTLLVKVIQDLTHTGPEIDAMTKMASDAMNKLRDSTNGANGSFQAWLATTGKMPSGAAAVADAQEKANEKAIEARQAWLNLVDAQNKGLVGQDAVTRGYKEYQAALDAANNSIKSHVLSVSDLTTKEAQLTADARAAISVFTNVRAAYDQGAASAGLLAAAHDQMTRALKAAKEGFSELGITIIQSLKDQAAAFDAWQKGYGAAALGLIKNQNDLQKAANDAAIAFNELARNALTDANAYNALGPALKVVEDAMKKADMSGNDLDVTLTKIGGNQGIPVITGGVTKISDAFGKIDPVIKDVNDRIAALGQTTTGAVAVMQGGTTKMVQLFSDVKKAVDDVNVDVEDLGASIPTMTGKFTEGLFTVTDGLSNVIKSTNNVNDNFKLTTESGTVEFGKVAASVDGVAASAGKATGNIINMKGGIAEAASAHQGLNDVAAKLPEILNVDTSTMERINSLIIEAGQSTQQWGKFMQSVADAAKASAEGFASFEQAAQDRMDANAKGGAVIPGAHYAPGGITQAIGSAGAEAGGAGLIPVLTPDGYGTIGGGEPPAGMKWNANHTGFIPDVTWINGVPYATGGAPAAGSSSSSGSTAPTLLDSGAVQALNTRLHQMFEDMATAGAVDVAQLQALAATIGEFVTVDATGLHIAWQNATATATATATQIQAAASGTAASFAQLAGSAGTVNLGLSGISSTLQAFPSAVTSIGPFADALDAATAIINAHVDALKTLQSQIDAANQANATAMAANLPGVRAYSAAPAHLSADELAMLNGQAPRVGIPNGTQFLIPSFPSPQAFVPASGSLHSGGTVNIYNPTVTNRSMLDDLAQQVADVLGR
jgi:hypothetical protein